MMNDEFKSRERPLTFSAHARAQDADDFRRRQPMHPMPAMRPMPMQPMQAIQPMDLQSDETAQPEREQCIQTLREKNNLLHFFNRNFIHYRALDAAMMGDLNQKFDKDLCNALQRLFSVNFPEMEEYLDSEKLEAGIPDFLNHLRLRPPRGDFELFQAACDWLETHCLKARPEGPRQQ